MATYKGRAEAAVTIVYFREFEVEADSPEEAENEIKERAAGMLEMGLKEGWERYDEPNWFKQEGHFDRKAIYVHKLTRET